MKRYYAPLGRMAELKHEHPERTAYRSGSGMFSDFEFQVWPNRPSMARTIRMQQRSADSRQWKAVQALRETEGY